MEKLMRCNSLKYFYKIAAKQKSDFPQDFRLWLMRKLVKNNFIDYSLSPADKMRKINIYINNNKGTTQLNSYLKNWKIETDKEYREAMEYIMNGIPKNLREPEEESSIYYYEDPEADKEL
jgi:hypothetical protein